MLYRLKIGLSALLFCLCLTNVVYADSSCITCHTDEDELTANLSKEKGVKSAMQAGTG